MTKEAHLEEIIEIFESNKKFEWLMIDSTYIKNHKRNCG